VDGPSTKPYEYEPGKFIDITRDCWQYQQTYECGGKDPLTPSCQPLIDQGCQRINTACEVYDSLGQCDIYVYDYSCELSPPTTRTTTQCVSPVAYCQDASCMDTSSQPNTEFRNSVGAVMALRDAAANFNDATNEIFTGTDMYCMNFWLWGLGVNNPCCRNTNGFLYNCSQAEKTLEQERNAKHAHHVSTWCDTQRCVLQILGACIGPYCEFEKHSFCVFGSVLGKLVNVQAREQLGISWGDPRAPDCRGLTPEELQSADLSLMDFTEFTSTFALPPGDETATINTLLDRITQGYGL